MPCPILAITVSWIVFNRLMKYRSNTEIIDAILQSSEDGENTKTHIIYRSYLSFFQLKQYLETFGIQRVNQPR